MQSTIVNITLTGSSYPIIINDSCFDLTSVKEILAGRKVALISNDKVAPLYIEGVSKELSKYCSGVFPHILADGEEYKNLDSWRGILDFLADNNINRSDILVSLGGGVVCDITGFAAASWMRGVEFIQIPTSLLAQVDASVGGKTGINHPKGKNLIGAFHQPKAVIINTATLKTLPSREFKSGLGETVKYAFINKPKFKKWLGENSDRINQQDLPTLTEMIAQCCEFKAEIVQQDEKELGVRALLNLGHTFAHAIETFTKYKEYTHGEAVAIGIAMAAELSVIMEKSNQRLIDDVRALMAKFELQDTIPKSINPEKLVELMRLDKKVKGNTHRLILMKDIGESYIQTNVCEKDILQAIENCQS